MASAGKITIVLGAALKTPQSVRFEDVTSFTFGTIPEVVQFIPASIGLPTGGSSITTKPTTRGKRPNVIVPNPPKIWKVELPTGGSPITIKLATRGRRPNVIIPNTPKVWRTKEASADIKPEAIILPTGGRISLRPISGKKGKQDSLAAGGRIQANPLTTQDRITTFIPHTKDEEKSVMFIVDSAPTDRVFSNPEKARKRERQQERKKRARQNKGQRPKPKRQAGPTKPTLADNNLFNMLRLIKKNSYTTIGLKLRTSPDRRADLYAINPEAQGKSILKNAYDTYKVAKKNQASQKALTTEMGISRSQFPLCMLRKCTKENYEIHTVRVIEESDPPPTHEAAPMRDRIVTRSQSSRRGGPKL